MENEWKPAVGDWVYSHADGLCRVIPTKDFENNLNNISVKDKARREHDLRSQDYRPATLNDFAVDIPDYGKVWFVEKENYNTRKYIARINPEDDINTKLYFIGGCDFPRPIHKIHLWELNALVKTYSITIMPQTLFERLSKEAKDEND
jgi:hypothetical protein